MQHLDEGIIHAYLDEALSPVESRRVQEHLASCSLCEGRVALAHGLIAGASRIAGYLDVTPGGVIPATTTKKKARWIFSAWPAAIAASLVAAIGLYSVRDRSAELPSRPVAVETPGVIRPKVTDSMPVASPPPHVEPQRVAAGEGSTRKPASTPLEVQLPPANAALPRSSVPAAQPAPAPRPAERDIRAARTRADAAADEIAAKAATQNRSAGGVAGGMALGATVGTAAPVAASAAAEPRAVPEPAARADSVSAFAGCYESTSTPPRTPTARAPDPQPPIRQPRGLEPARRLPASGYAPEERYDRFALMDDPAPTGGQFAVRTLDTAGRPDALIYGAGWSVLGGRATVRNSQGQIVATLTKSDDGVRSATVRVISCRK